MAEHPNAQLYRPAIEAMMSDPASTADYMAGDIVWWQIGSPREDGKLTERWAFSDDTQRSMDFFSRFGGAK